MYVLFIIILAAGALFYASYSLRAGMYVKAYCRRRTDRRVVALTFDDGPHPERTPRVLDVLKRHGVKAAFFVTGEQARACPGIVKRMADEGHLVGNHSWHHTPRFPLLGARAMTGELRRCDALLEELTGSRPEWFRPPYGVTNPTLGRVVHRGGYRVAGWDVRSLDTFVRRPRERVFARVCRLLRPGSVVLLHDDRPQSDALLEMIINHLNREQYRVERLDQLFEL